MTLSTRSRVFARFAPVALVAAMVGLGSAGCEDKHIGRLCDLTVQADAGLSGGNTAATINASALECPSRICLLPAAQVNTNTTALCTAECGSDDDCGGETTGNAADPHCKKGFACMIATTVGDFCCRKLCVCKDFVDTSAGITTPASCKPGNHASCKNVP
jgi:hypothetical protein